MKEPEGILNELARACGGEITEVSGPLPDGSGYALMSMPLPKDHWQIKDPDAFNDPPMPMRMGVDNSIRKELTKALIEAGRYAVRSATDNGKIVDFDPDALLQNLVVGMFGYHTYDGLSHVDDLEDASENNNPVFRGQ